MSGWYLQPLRGVVGPLWWTLVQRTLTNPCVLHLFEVTMPIIDIDKDFTQESDWLAISIWLLIPKRNAVFLFRALKFAMSDILNLLPANEQGLFSPKQGGWPGSVALICKLSVCRQGKYSNDKDRKKHKPGQNLQSFLFTVGAQWPLPKGPYFDHVSTVSFLKLEKQIASIKMTDLTSEGIYCFF